MKKHTPGPWHKLRDPMGKYGIASDADGVFLAVVLREADACLIAEAPTLLDLVTLALPYVEDAADDPAHKSQPVKALATRMRKAIAKTEVP